jgi:hypothetical protein
MSGAMSATDAAGAAPEGGAGAGGVAVETLGEGGLAAGRWWPARHDELVARWIETARRARQAPPQSH